MLGAVWAVIKWCRPSPTKGGETSETYGDRLRTCKYTASNGKICSNEIKAMEDTYNIATEKDYCKYHLCLTCGGPKRSSQFHCEQCSKAKEMAAVRIMREQHEARPGPTLPRVLPSPLLEAARRASSEHIYDQPLSPARSIVPSANVAAEAAPTLPARPSSVGAKRRSRPLSKVFACDGGGESESDRTLKPASLALNLDQPTNGQVALVKSLLHSLPTPKSFGVEETVLGSHSTSGKEPSYFFASATPAELGARPSPGRQSSDV